MSTYNYILSRYEGFIGVPKQYVEDELMCTPEELRAFKMYLKEKGAKPAAKFIPFDIFVEGLEYMINPSPEV